MPDKPSKFYSTTSFLACFAIACLCTSGPAWAALLLPFANNIAGNVASNHFSRLFNLAGFSFFGKNDNKPHPQQALRLALIVAVSKALEQLEGEIQGGYGKGEIESLRKGWLKGAEDELEKDPPEVAEWSYLLEGSSKDPQYNLLRTLHIELFGPNADYGDDEFLHFFNTHFPEYVSNHFQQALADNHNAWVG